MLENGKCIEESTHGRGGVRLTAAKTRVEVHIEDGTKSYGSNVLRAAVAADLYRLRQGIRPGQFRLSQLLPPQVGPACGALYDALRLNDEALEIWRKNQTRRADVVTLLLTHPEHEVLSMMAAARLDVAVHADENVVALQTRGGWLP